MKSQRRHELQHNELAAWLAGTAATIKPYQNMVLTAVAVVLVTALGYTWWSKQSAADTARAWDRLNAAVESGDLAKLTRVIEGEPNTEAAHVAAVVLADYRLAGGCTQLFVSKATAEQELSKAIDGYQSVLRQSRVASVLERAVFGLARAKEAKGDLETAGQLYAELSANWPHGAYAAAATQRAEDLKRQSIRRLYDDFRHFDPQPAFSSEPDDRPSFDLDSLPSDGPAVLPEGAPKLKLDGQDEEKGNEQEKKAPEQSDQK